MNGTAWDIDEKEQEKLSQVKSLFISKSTSIVNILIGEIDCSAHFILEKINVDPNNSKLYSNDSNSIITKNEQTLLLGCKNTIIPNGVKTIFWAAFLGCDIEKINIPSSVETIDELAFGNCKKLTEITINNGVKKIGDYAFKNTNIEKIVIPSSVEIIGCGAFSNCKNLKEISVDDNNPFYYSNGSNSIIRKDNQVLIFGCKETIIPKGIKRIARYAFEGCDIKEIIIPSNVRSIPPHAFYNCTNLEKLTIEKNVKKYVKMLLEIV